ncbi:MAG TPA: VWA domain-containing protein, partial [Blastocatellia bacterium]|nr:VWA domain-containing protein [Blastocatellia bacterium]
MPYCRRLTKREAALAFLALALLFAHIGPIAPARVSADLAQQKKEIQKRDKESKDSGDDDKISLHADLVVVNATVADPGGKYVHGLSAKDFKITEEGVPQTVDAFSAEEAPFAAAILIDMSASMERKLGMARSAAASFVDNIRDDDQVAVYGFNTEIQLFQEFSNLRDINDRIWDVTAKDNTRVFDCVAEAVESLAKRPERKRAILLLTDGWDSASKHTRESVLK